MEYIGELFCVNIAVVAAVGWGGIKLLTHFNIKPDTPVVALIKRRKPLK